MASVKIKEVQAEWKEKSLCELRGFYEERIRCFEYDKNELIVKSQEIIDLDQSKPNFIRRMSDAVGDLTYIKTDLKWESDMIAALKPIFEAKVAEGLNQEKYESYMKRNADQVEPLLKKVAEMEKEALEATEGFWSELEPQMIKAIHKQTLQETMHMIMSRIGNMTEVCRIDYNPNRGFDGVFKGDKGSINVSTILAGGWNIQKLHYRTILHQF